MNSIKYFGVMAACSISVLAAGQTAHADLVTQVVAVSRAGEIWHRKLDDSGLVGTRELKKLGQQPPGFVDDLDVGASDGAERASYRLHIVALSNGNLFHSVVGWLDEQWQDFRNIGDALGHDKDGQWTSVGTDGDLVVCGTTNDGNIWVTGRGTDSWSPWERVQQSVSSSDVFTKVDCAVGYAWVPPSSGLMGYYKRVLHIVGLTSDGVIKHTMKIDDSWQTYFGSVSQVASVIGTSGIRDVDCSVQHLTKIHIVATGYNLQQHTIGTYAGDYSSSSWAPFRNIAGTGAGSQGSESTGGIACDHAGDGDCDVAASIHEPQGGGNTGGIYITRRDGIATTWSPYSDLRNTTASQAERFSKVALAHGSWYVLW